ncbi:Hypothetical predicted protein [Mytilus galloprovincialis]|uniref:Uncharacterized protein n=1 Tax=Mytilus galloprovincialis TaxID=29158 RepID=A0A8B6DSM8_MYTGA|nr:Hypothetical predicted protein [Mytilus galloprovincialis]
MFDLEPEDRYDRRKWLTDMKLTFPVSIYTYQHGNYMGNLNFLWRIHDDENLRNDMKQLSAVEKLRKEIPIYSSRQVRKTFIDRYTRTGLKPAVLRDMYRFLTNDDTASESSLQENVDIRVIESIMDADDPDLLYDLRKHNGNPKCEDLEPFWKELESFLNEKTVVHERRGADHEYMPCAISLSDLRNQIASRLTNEARIPNLDMLVTARTVPIASYANPAERIMSLLNLALQNVALERPDMIEDYERKMKRNG